MNKEEDIFLFSQKKIFSKQTMEGAGLPLPFIDEMTGAQKGEESHRVLGRINDRSHTKFRSYHITSPVFFFIRDFGKASAYL